MAMDYGVDPLRWDIKWINGNVCYRLHPKVESTELKRRPQADELEADYTDIHSDEENCVPAFQLRATSEEEKSGKIRASIHVPDRYLCRICGQQHSRRKEIEADTGTSIKIPEKGSGEDLVIFGNSDEAVFNCVSRIRALVDAARAHDSTTHCVSVPLAFDVVKKNLREFQFQALQAVPALTERLFVRERKLHLTICCLCLQDETEVSRAKEILLDCHDLVSETLKDQPLKICIRGLEIMNDDPGMVNVLYAKVQENGLPDAGRLQKLCDAILERFRGSRLLVSNRASDQEHLKLHMTLMNSKFADDPNAIVNPGSGKESFRKTYENVKPFSAKKLIQTLGDYDFGIVQLTQVELNVIAQVEPGTGYYRGVTKLLLPTDSRQS